MAKVSIAVRITWSEGGVVDRSRDHGWGRYSDGGGRGSQHSFGAMLPGSTLGFVTPSLGDFGSYLMNLHHDFSSVKWGNKTNHLLIWL